MGQAANEPGYVGLLRSGELERRVHDARMRMESCVLCGRHCRVDRFQEPFRGWCRTGPRATVRHAAPHFGEEDPVRGTRGSGTIFFGGCNLGCAFCQNWDLSTRPDDDALSPEGLAARMLALQDAGCHNINLVSPSHVVAPILDALLIAARGGLRLPIVYNSGGYDSREALGLLDGVVDVYMPDAKYGRSDVALRLSRVRDYVRVNRAALREMHRQVGDLVLDDEGVARRGLLVRHLVLPGDLANTSAVLGFLAREISKSTYVNLMDQYHPAYRSHEHPPLDRPLTEAEYRAAIRSARRRGLVRLDGKPSRFPWVIRDACDAPAPAAS